jgi:hypothetical protein
MAKLRNFLQFRHAETATVARVGKLVVPTFWRRSEMNRGDQT